MEESTCEKLAVALGNQMVWNRLAILNTLAESTYLVHQEELDRMGEVGKEGIGLNLRDRLGPEVLLRSSGSAEVALVGRADNLAGADETEARVPLLQHGVI